VLGTVAGIYARPIEIVIRRNFYFDFHVSDIYAFFAPCRGSGRGAINAPVHRKSDDATAAARQPVVDVIADPPTVRMSHSALVTRKCFDVRQRPLALARECQLCATSGLPANLPRK
jgi:hypothetical protein